MFGAVGFPLKGSLRGFLERVRYGFLLILRDL